MRQNCSKDRSANQSLPTWPAVAKPTYDTYGALQSGILVSQYLRRRHQDHTRYWMPPTLRVEYHGYTSASQGTVHDYSYNANQRPSLWDGLSGNSASSSQEDYVMSERGGAGSCAVRVFHTETRRLRYAVTRHTTARPFVSSMFVACSCFCRTCSSSG